MSIDEPAPPAPGRGTAVWWAACRPLAELDLAMLDRDERRRLDRQHSEAARERSALARVVLRLVLGERLGVPPGEVPLDWSRGPRLIFADQREGAVHPWAGVVAPAGHGPWLSLSHSGTRVVVAVSEDGPVGIDLEPAARAERIRPGTVERLSAPGEIAALDQLRGAERQAAALQLWTAKEALLKATGDGLTLAPGSVEVAPVPQPTTLVHFDHRPELVGACRLAPLTADPDWVGTVAVLSATAGPVTESDAEALLERAAPTAR